MNKEHETTTHLSPPSSVDKTSNATGNNDEEQPEEAAEEAAARLRVACELVDVDAHKVLAGEVGGTGGGANGALRA